MEGGTSKTIVSLELEKKNYINIIKKLFDKDRMEHQPDVGDMVYVENGNKLKRKN